MTLRHRRIVALLLLAGGFVTLVLWWRSDRHRIGRQIREIQKLVAKRPTEHNLTSLNKARRISELFAPEFEVHAPQYGVTTRDRKALIGAIHNYRSRSDHIAMRTSERELWIDSDHGRATLRMVVSFSSSFRGAAGREAYLLEMNLVSRESAWRIDFVDLVEVLEGPGAPW